MEDAILFVGQLTDRYHEFAQKYQDQYLIRFAEGREAVTEILKTHSFSVCVIGSIASSKPKQFPRWINTQMPGTVLCKIVADDENDIQFDSVNENHVYLLLREDFSVAQIRRLIEAACLEYDRREMERNFVREMFTGSLNILLNIVDCQPVQFVSTTIIADTVNEIAKALSRKCGWDCYIAARLCTTGLSVMSTADVTTFFEEDVLSAEHRKAVLTMFRKSSELVAHLPRLDGVVEILKNVDIADGWISSSTKTTIADCNFLMAGFYWNLLSFKGNRKEQILITMKNLFPNFAEGLFNSIDALDCQISEQLAVALERDQLRVGMVLAQEVHDHDGNIVARRGRRLTTGLLENLEEISEKALKVVAGSCPIVVEDHFIRTKWQ